MSVVQSGLCRFNVDSCSSATHFKVMLSNRAIIIPHSHARTGLCDRGYPFIISYVYMRPPNKFEWHYSGRLTVSNTHGRLLVEYID